MDEKEINSGSARIGIFGAPSLVATDSSRRPQEALPSPDDGRSANRPRKTFRVRRHPGPPGVTGVRFAEIPEWPSRFAGSDGSIWSLKKGEWRKRKTAKHKSGHLYIGMSVSVWPDGGFRMCKVHRLVLSAFQGPPPPGTCCCHFNGVPDDNRIENLRWDTPAANSADTIRHGRTGAVRGEKNVNAKITDAIAVTILARHRSGERQIDIARDLGIGHRIVQAVATGKSWNHATGLVKNKTRKSANPACLWISTG